MSLEMSVHGAGLCKVLAADGALVGLGACVFPHVYF